MHTTKMTGLMSRSLEARFLELDERLAALERRREGNDNPDATALQLQLSRERNQIADALAGATLIDDYPFDTEAIEIGDTVTVREIESEAQERYVLVDGTTGSLVRQNRVSAISPLGAALVGRSKGDEVVIETPRGSGSYVILDFERSVDARTRELSAANGHGRSLPFAA
jgi:transcription elongation factor GreA